MIITVYNFKGGQGKSKIALNLAMTLNYGIITNDEVSSHDLVLPEDKIFKVPKNEPIPHNFKSDDNIIYDLGGFIDDRVIEAIKISDYIIIPVTNENDDDENIRVSVQTIDSVEAYNKNIIIVANKTELKKSGTKVIHNDYQIINDIMNKLYQYPVFEMKKSKAVSRIAKDKKSIKDMMKEGGITAYSYAEINKQFNKIIEYLTLNKN